MNVVANGIEMRYEATGAGPWVVFSHSLACDHSMWEPQVAALARRYSVLRYDARGHGGSAAPAGPYTLEQLADDAIALMDALRIERAHFVGLSMGGMIAQHFALKAPRRLLSLTLADTASRYPADVLPVWEERIRVVSEQGMEPMVEPTLERWFTERYRNDHPEIMARIGALIRATPTAGYIGCAHAIPRLDVTHRLSAVGLPTLVMVGEQDPGTPVAMAREIQGAIAGSRLEIIPDAAHLSNIQQAERFNGLLLGFLDGVAPG